MKPYYEDSYAQIWHGDCREILPSLPKCDLLLTDPPYNMNYHYESYDDDLDDDKYYQWLSEILGFQFCMIHYPESTFRLSYMHGIFPSKCVAWIYNANTPRQWRMISWFGIEPDLELDGQDYKNPSDARIAERISRGEQARLYDWWEFQQIKNVSDEKTEHPCQIPLALMQRIIRITPANLIIDPFMGSGTTLRAAKDLQRKSIGIEIEEKYCEIAAKRLAQEVLAL